MPPTEPDGTQWATYDDFLKEYRPPAEGVRQARP